MWRRQLAVNRWMAPALVTTAILIAVVAVPALGSSNQANVSGKSSSSAKKALSKANSALKTARKALAQAKTRTSGPQGPKGHDGAVGGHGPQGAIGPPGEATLSTVATSSLIGASPINIDPSVALYSLAGEGGHGKITIMKKSTLIANSSTDFYQSGATPSGVSCTIQIENAQGQFEWASQRMYIDMLVANQDVSLALSGSAVRGPGSYDARVICNPEGGTPRFDRGDLTVIAVATD